MGRGEMRHVELDEESVDDDAAVPPPPARARRRWWVAAVAGSVVLGVLAFQAVADARDRAAVARLADVPGVLAPIDESMPVLWRSDSLGDVVWSPTATHGAIIGPVVHDDGSQHVVAHDLATGEELWSTELYGPDPVRA